MVGKKPDGNWQLKIENSGREYSFVYEKPSFPTEFIEMESGRKGCSKANLSARPKRNTPHSTLPKDCNAPRTVVAKTPAFGRGV